MSYLANLGTFQIYAVLITTPCLIGLVSSTPYSPSTTTGNTLTSSSYTYYYMDDGFNQCGPYSYNYLDKRSKVAYIQAWSTVPKTTTTHSCELTFSAYAADGIKYSFSDLNVNFINDCSVTLYVYSGTNTYSPLVASYDCFTSFSTLPSKYVSSGDLTFKLVNNGLSTGFDFKIKVTSYDKYNDAGLIVGLTLGCFSFSVFIFVVACVSVRARRRRLLRQRTALIATGTPVVAAGVVNTTYGSNYQQHIPPPAGTYQAYPSPPPYYQQPTNYQQPPAGAVGSQLPPQMSNSEPTKK